MKAKTFKAVCFSVAGFLLVLLIALSAAVGAFASDLDEFLIGRKDSEGSSAARADGAKLAQQIQEEGTVLVKNEKEDKSALLPLNKDQVSKMNVFGWGAVDWVISGSGSGQVKRGAATDFLTALKDYGVEYNQDLINMYKNFRPNREFSIMGSHAGGATDANPGGSGSLHSFNYDFSRLYEPDINDSKYYTADLLSAAKEFSNTAIVVIGRVSGESNDSPKVQYKMNSGKTASSGLGAVSTTDKDRTYLEISTEEEALLKYVGENYKDVIVLINSTNVMELGFMKTIPGLDACLIVATTGSVGTKAIPKILYGEISPSGKLADTYAYDLTTSSTYVDTGSGNDTTNFYTNGKGLYPADGTDHTNGSTTVKYEGVAYTDYREGIYVGYKWYETADKDGFWTSSFAKEHWKAPDGQPVNGYYDVVQYPFGYGLSYTNFSWEIDYLKLHDGSSLTADSEIVVGVTVKNIGSAPGQDVVELYYGTEYKANGIEKSAVTLGAFAKTQKILAPGDEEYVELKMKASDMASYDYEEKKVSGGGYILEQGAYTLTLRTDAHELAGKKVLDTGKGHKSDTIIYNVGKDIRCNEKAKNLFTGSEAGDGVAIDGNSDGTANITYLSRADFANTFPIALGENRAMADSVKALNLYTKAMADQWASERSDAADVTFGDSSKGDVVGTTVNGTFTINDYGRQLGLDYDDDEWENLLDRITKAEMEELVLKGYTQTAAIKSIGKPKTTDYDGPNQVGSFAGVSEKATGFSSIVLAQTWNVELAYSMGLAFGAECAAYGVQGWYGPGINIHRSPFGGRNYEYYSEDALISGIMCAKVVSAAKNRGVFCYLKHLCLYETESGRDGMYTWVTEQALREIYLKPFEIAVKEGGSTAIMTSYGRIGAVWTGGSKTLLQDLVTDEWGFKGAFLTDYSDHGKYMDADAMIRAGGDLFMTYGGGSFDYETSSNAYKQALRSATKDLVYMWLNAVATNAEYNEGIANGTIKDTIVVQSKPEYNFRWYIPVLVVVDVLFAAGAGVLIFFAIKKKDPVVEAYGEPAEPTQTNE